MDLTPAQAELLIDIRRLRERNIAADPHRLPPGAIGLTYNERLLSHHRAVFALDGVVLASLPKILGRPLSGAESKLFGRAAVALEDGCLIRRYIGPSGNRMTHLELTECGEQLAAELEQSQAAQPTIN